MKWIVCHAWMILYPAPEGAARDPVEMGSTRMLMGTVKVYHFFLLPKEQSLQEPYLYLEHFEYKKNVNILGENSAFICMCMNMERKLASM